MGFEQRSDAVPHNGVNGHIAVLIAVSADAQQGVVDSWRRLYSENHFDDTPVRPGSLPLKDRRYFQQFLAERHQSQIDVVAGAGFSVFSEVVSSDC